MMTTRLAAVLLVLVSAVPAMPARAVTGVDPEAEELMFEQLNRARTERGLPALVRDPALDVIARGHSLDMCSRGRIGHLSPVTGSPEARIRGAGYPAVESGENVGRGDDIETLERALLDSPGHRANLLSPRFDRVGVGVVRGDGRYVTQLFARRQPPVDPAGWRDRVRSAVAAHRARAKRSPLAADPTLDSLAAAAARSGASSVRDALAAATAGPRGGTAWGSVLTVSEFEEIELPEALLRESHHRLGVGVHWFPAREPPNVFVVLLAGS